jgi:16S rRNA (adenine1518-N6/adenine1519-N6)-dimethyltransferase
VKSRQKFAPFAKRSLGQNFLTDPNYIQKIIEAVEPKSGDLIVEIGPGRGALTEHLVESGATVIAIELDHELSRSLADHFGNNEKVKVLERDVLEVEFSQLTERNGLKLVANLPYYISTAIVQRLARQRTFFSELFLMLQWEVVDRITAEPGNSERGYLTILVEASFDIERLFEVPPSAFRPVPKVQSAVVRLAPKGRNDFDNDEFRAVVSTAFVQKRKTILNNLKGRYPNANAALDVAGIDASRRAETLSLDEWSELYRSLTEISA